MLLEGEAREGSEDFKKEGENTKEKAKRWLIVTKKAGGRGGIGLKKEGESMKEKVKFREV